MLLYLCKGELENLVESTDIKEVLMAELTTKREELIDNIYELCAGLNMTTPEGFPDDMSDEDMEKWLGVWDEFDPFEYLPEEEPMTYITSNYETPICNHVQGLTHENIGYTSGILIDGIPFEAELYEYETEKGKNVDIGVMLPLLNERIISHKDNSNVTEFAYEITAKENGILPIGMLDNGYEEDDDIIHWYVNLINENKLINFTSCWWNGSVRYLTDVRGTKLAYVVISITVQDEEHAQSNLIFKNFPIRKNNPYNFKVVK